MCLLGRHGGPSGNPRSIGAVPTSCSGFSNGTRGSKLGAFAYKSRSACDRISKQYERLP